MHAVESVVRCETLKIAAVNQPQQPVVGTGRIFRFLWQYVYKGKDLDTSYSATYMSQTRD